MDSSDEGYSSDESIGPEAKHKRVQLAEDLVLERVKSERNKDKLIYEGKLYTFWGPYKDLLIYRCECRKKEKGGCHCRLHLMADTGKLRYVVGAHTCTPTPWKPSNARVKDKQRQLIKDNPDMVGTLTSKPLYPLVFQISAARQRRGQVGSGKIWISFDETELIL